MAANSIKNLAASVHQRLLNKAKESSRPFNELLQKKQKGSLLHYSLYGKNEDATPCAFLNSLK